MQPSFSIYIFSLFCYINFTAIYLRIYLFIIYLLIVRAKGKYLEYFRGVLK